MEGVIPNGRKITLNIALAHQYVINPIELIKYFDPNDYLIKITPMHITNACQQNSIYNVDLIEDEYKYYYPYKEIESQLKNEGYDVIVFVPSKEEDESRITCGNAILSDNIYKIGKLNINQ